MVPAAARLGAGLVLTALAAGCGSTPQASGSPPPSASASVLQGAFTECATADLRSPNGSRLDLTGTWQATGGGNIYFVSQVGACVWWAGGFPSGQDAVEAFGSVYGLGTVVFQGIVDPSFTLHGQWAETRSAPQHRGPIGYGESTWEIGFEGGRATTLTSRATGQEDGDEILTKLSDEFLEP